MFEDILRSAKKANGENFDKPPTYPMIKTPQYDAPQKWYEKKWGVGLMLIICFPLGAILLWQNPRYSNQIKGVVTASILFLILFGYFSTDKPSPHRQATTYTQKTAYDDTDKRFLSYQGSAGYSGYLNKGAEWLDGAGNFHYNSKKVKVEIGKQKIVASDGRLTQIYFLEGEYIGSWGYTAESFISR